jgi:hypothetical protein
MKLSLLGGTTAVALLSGVANAATPDDWRSQSIYFLLTDRFARADNSTTATCNTDDRVCPVCPHVHRVYIIANDMYRFIAVDHGRES